MSYIAFLIILIVILSATAESSPEVIQAKSREIKVPVALIPLLLKEIAKDDIQFPDPKNRFSAHEIDLDGDGKPEIEVTANSGAANSPMWIFSKQGKEFIQLLKADVGTYGYSVLKPVSYRYHDILTIEHASAAEHQITTYRFNGKKYKQISRFMETAVE